MTALITGAGRGIGKRLAIGFAHAGIRVGLVGRSQGELDVTKLEIEHAGGTAHRFRADVRDFEQLSAAVERMTGIYGDVQRARLWRTSILSARIGLCVKHRPQSDWKEVFETNVIGTMNACRLVLPQDDPGAEQRKILAIADDSASTSSPQLRALYAASKAAVVRFVESVAEEVRNHNVQINCFSPGSAYTSMTDEILSADELAGSREVEEAEQIRLTGGVPPDRQIQIALFLTSERSESISPASSSTSPTTGRNSSARTRTTTPGPCGVT